MLLFIKLVSALWKFLLTNEGQLLDSLQLPNSFLDGASSLGHCSAQQIRGALIEWMGTCAVASQ